MLSYEFKAFLALSLLVCLGNAFQHKIHLPGRPAVAPSKFITELSFRGANCANQTVARTMMSGCHKEGETSVMRMCMDNMVMVGRMCDDTCMKCTNNHTYTLDKCISEELDIEYECADTIMYPADRFVRVDFGNDTTCMMMETITALPSECVPGGRMFERYMCFPNNTAVLYRCSNEMCNMNCSTTPLMLNSCMKGDNISPRSWTSSTSVPIPSCTPPTAS
jgi:hypothetical protein